MGGIEREGKVGRGDMEYMVDKINVEGGIL